MYNILNIIILILLGICALIGLSYLFFTRQTKNFFISIISKYRKRYVICHVRYENNREDVYKIVPNPSGLTQVGNYHYELLGKYVAMYWNNRAHYILDEKDSIPRNFDKQTKENIIFQSAEIQASFDNSVMEYLFSKKKELLIQGLFILGIISTIAIIYNIYELQNIQSYIISIQNSQIQRIP